MQALTAYLCPYRTPSYCGWTRPFSVCFEKIYFFKITTHLQRLLTYSVFWKILFLQNYHTSPWILNPVLQCDLTDLFVNGPVTFITLCQNQILFNWWCCWHLYTHITGKCPSCWMKQFQATWFSEKKCWQYFMNQVPPVFTILSVNLMNLEATKIMGRKDGSARRLKYEKALLKH